MNPNDWNQPPHFAALDWASDYHDVVISDRTGALIAGFRFAHSPHCPFVFLRPKAGLRAGARVLDGSRLAVRPRWTSAPRRGPFTPLGSAPASILGRPVR